MSSKANKNVPAKLEIDADTADNITVLNLKEHLRILNEVNDDLMVESEDLSDYARNEMAKNLLIKLHIKEVLKYFGN